MNVIGHLLIANEVRNTVFRQTGTRLSLMGFLYGNILPDISDQYDENPHFFNSSFHFVLDRIAKLQKDMDAGRIQSFSCSRNTGIITHYLSDFFCYAHTEQCAYSIYRHHWYELCMLRQFRYGQFICKNQKSDPPSDLLALEDFIYSRLKSYHKVCPNKKQDFNYALMISSEVVICMVNEAQCHIESHFFDRSEIQSYIS